MHIYMSVCACVLILCTNCKQTPNSGVVLSMKVCSAIVLYIFKGLRKMLPCLRMSEGW